MRNSERRQVMGGRGRVIPLGLVAAFAVAGGTAWAVTQAGEPSLGGFAPTSGVVAHGIAPSGRDYTVSRIDPAQFGRNGADAFCAEIRTPVAAAQGCNPVSDANGRINGQPLRPSLALLGTDRFFTILAPEGVEAMEVRVEGQAKSWSSRSLAADSAGKLLIVPVDGPMVTSRDPTSSRRYEVRLLGANGETIREIAASDPG
jgi:hypothetical protein